MKKSLLICIAFHYNPDRLGLLKDVLQNIIDNYPADTDIIIDCNTFPIVDWQMPQVTVHEHHELQHPFHLTWKHRFHMKENIDLYENFMYLEDDMLLPYENYVNYMENFKLLWPRYIPSFIRIEQKDGERYVVDVTQEQQLFSEAIGVKKFATLDQPYHGFWIMPGKELKETMTSDFARYDQSRETAASYPMWELRKQPMVEIEDGQVSEKCYAYHISNNYARSAESPFAKINPKDIFI